MVGEEKIGMTLKDCFEYLYNMKAEKQAAVDVCSFDVSRRGSPFGGEPAVRTEVNVRVKKLRSKGRRAGIEIKWALV